MGGDAMFRTIRRSAAEGLALHVLITIASFADEHGLAYPSLRTIQKRAKVSRNTVIESIRQLVASGQLAMLERGHRDRDHVKDARRRGGFQATHYYQVLAVDPVDRLHGQAGKVVHTVNPLGGLKTARQVVQNVPFRRAGSLFKNKSVQNESARRTDGGPVSNEQIIGLYTKATHGILDEDPLCVGEPLLHALERWAIRRQLNYSIDQLGAAIERALDERKQRSEGCDALNRRKAV